ncbi:hypothetical protein E2P81_ATG11485 [Venturia nashicola]|uniref:Uncharacterized protein n=1 Tax=Venturia nashicola TaxID=86259 RepID=A0A4Z1PJM6_9PEZI|nr:hypothetical protein E6O75_ATG11176 [Venturia nashicola]TLD35366.1 hypothetical protein E2P81_ATG11485 [Venturia nashicola]
MTIDEKMSLPSYEESTTFQDQRPDGQRIIDSLSTVRATHIRSTVNTHIYPLVEQRAERGLAHTVLALIPSDVIAVDEFAIKSGFSEEESSVAVMEIHGIISDEEDINQVRLEGQINTYEFWKQKDVVNDLERVLQEKLASSPIFSKDSKVGTDPGPLVIAPISPSPQPERRGFFGRRSSAKQPMKVAAPGVVKAVKSNRLEVKVDLEEVCLRTVSPFGLLETVTRPAIVVRVNAHC